MARLGLACWQKKHRTSSVRRSPQRLAAPQSQALPRQALDGQPQMEGLLGSAPAKMSIEMISCIAGMRIDSVA